MRSADRRSTTNRDARGGTADRRARKVWLLLHFDIDLGPDAARCSFGCGTIVTLETISPDRYPIAGVDGGTYRRNNIRPACLPCNVSHGGADGSRRRLAKRDGPVSDQDLVQALMRDIAHLQEQAQVVHAAVIHHDLWGPRCDPTLEWTVPLIRPLPEGELVGEDNPAMTCPACAEAKVARDLAKAAG